MSRSDPILSSYQPAYNLVNGVVKKIWESNERIGPILNPFNGQIKYIFITHLKNIDPPGLCKQKYCGTSLDGSNLLFYDLDSYLSSETQLGPLNILKERINGLHESVGPFNAPNIIIILKSVGKDPWDVFIGDANNDGYNDIITANRGRADTSLRPPD